MTVRILVGDALARLRELPDESVQTCVTSPPYFALRDYGVEGQIGLEETMGDYLSRLVDVFREVRRVLRPDGVAWVNMGDAYTEKATPEGLKPKDLMGMPWRVAFALQDDGWYLRQDIIWHKPNPMPESIRDRFTKAHEYIFLLAKSRRYYWDQDAIAEPCSEGTHRRLAQDVEAQVGSFRAHAGEGLGGRPMKAMRGRAPGNKTHKGTTAYAEGDEFQRTKAGLVDYAERKRAEITNGNWTRPRKGAPNGSGVKNNPSFDDAMAVMPDMRNPRSVWSITTEPFKEAHFATFPRALPRRCILASTRPGDTVLDPFGGAGTVGLVADELQRDAILIELNPAYADMARKRIAAAAPLLATVAVS